MEEAWLCCCFKADVCALVATLFSILGCSQLMVYRWERDPGPLHAVSVKYNIFN